MSTKIIYSSKYGCTEDCAEILKSGVSGPVELVSIDRTNPHTITIENVDTVILGSSIYVGMVSKKMRVFCNENIDLLIEKKVGIFICCAFPAQLNEYLSANFPSILLKNAVVTKDFGGEARIEHMKLMDKLIMKTVAKENAPILNIAHDNIESFIKEINS